MISNAVELPPITDPFILCYLRLFNSKAPDVEVQCQRELLQERFPELLAACREHFAQCDGIKMQQLLAERDSVGEQAKSILSQINELQRDSGMHTSMQSQLQDYQQKATRKLQAFTPRNRTIATLQQIEEDRVEEIELKKAVEQSKQAVMRNHRNILETGEQLKGLNAQYQRLEAREKQLAHDIEELKLPFEQRNQRSSIVWTLGGSTFELQKP